MARKGVSVHSVDTASSPSKLVFVTLVAYRLARRIRLNARCAVAHGSVQRDLRGIARDRDALERVCEFTGVTGARADRLKTRIALRRACFSVRKRHGNGIIGPLNIP